MVIPFFIYYGYLHTLANDQKYHWEYRYLKLHECEFQIQMNRNYRKCCLDSLLEWIVLQDGGSSVIFLREKLGKVRHVV